MKAIIHGDLDYSGNFVQYSQDHLTGSLILTKDFGYDKETFSRFINIFKKNFKGTDKYDEILKLLEKYPEEGSKEIFDKIAITYFKNYIEIELEKIENSNKFQFNIRSLDMSNTVKKLVTNFVADNVNINVIENLTAYWESYDSWIKYLNINNFNVVDFEKKGKFDLENIVERLIKIQTKRDNYL